MGHIVNFDNFLKQEVSIGVVGLGYVGLPLAVLLSSKFKVTGFDINKNRINELKDGFDQTREVEKTALIESKLEFSHDENCLKGCSFIIVTVPTPIDSHKNPDLTPVRNATETVARNLSKGTIVVYESTVYPGVTEEICVPILEELSGLKWQEAFNVGYSPERVNPGDKKHTIDKIIKVVSGDTPEVLDLVSKIYGAVVTAGIHEAPTIKVAEAAKVIENTQRDLNIALMNELSIIFDKLGVCSSEVLDAAGTKWNFLPFRPGLVGGHCIGVDPYYLTYKAEQVGYHPEVILAGRRINDGMGKFIADKTIKLLIEQGHSLADQPVTIFGATFKENCPDLRNSKVSDVIKELQKFGIRVQICDPEANEQELQQLYGTDVRKVESLEKSSALILAVAHNQFKEVELDKFISENAVIIDVKNFYRENEFLNKGYHLWKL